MGPCGLVHELGRGGVDRARPIAGLLPAERNGPRRRWVDVKTTQTRLGHSDPRLTLAIYAQAVTDADRAAAVKLGARSCGHVGFSARTASTPTRVNAPEQGVYGVELTRHLSNSVVAARLERLSEKLVSS